MADLNWQLELDAKLDGIEQMLSHVTEFEDKLDAIDTRLRVADRKLEHFGQTGRRTGTHVEGVSRKLREMNKETGHAVGFVKGLAGAFFDFGKIAGGTAIGTAIGQGIMSGVDMAVGGLKSLASKIVNVGGEAERTNKAMMQMFGSGGGSRLLGMADQLAKKMEFDDGTIKGAFLSLGQQGFKEGDVMKAVLAAADMAAGAGTRDAARGRFDQAVQVLGMVRRSGQVSSKGLGAFGIQEDLFLKRVGQSRGISSKAAEEAMQAGKIPRGELLARLMESVQADKNQGAPIGSKALEFGKTMSARAGRLEALPDQFVSNLAGTGGFSKLSDVLDKWTMSLDPDSPNGKRIFTALSGALEKIAGALEKIDLEKVSLQIANIFERLPGWLEATASALSKVLGMLVKTDELLSGKTRQKLDTAVDIGGGMKLLPDAPEAGIRKAAANQASTRSALGNWVTDRLNGKAFGRLSPDEAVFGVRSGMGADELLGLKEKLGPERFAARMAELGKAAGTGMREGLAAGAPGVAGAAGELGATATTAAAEKLDVHSPSRVFHRLGAFSAEGFAQGLESSELRVSDAVDRTLGLAAPSASARSAGGLRGGGAVTVSVPITVNVDGAREGVDPDDIARRIRDLVPAQLAAALEQLQVEMGVA